MVRPKPPVIHESEVEKYQGEIRMGRECPGHVYIYNHTYLVGDTVDWWKDDCYWIAKILKIESDTNTAKVSFETINFNCFCYCTALDTQSFGACAIITSKVFTIFASQKSPGGYISQGALATAEKASDLSCDWAFKMQLRFPPSPHGEGKTDMAPLKNLRPSFTWTPKRQWRQMGLKVRVEAYLLNFVP